MNNETIFKCAQMAAAKQMAAFGNVDQDILDLLAEVTPAPVVQAAVVEAVAVEVVEAVAEPVAEAAPAEEAEEK